MVKYLLKTALTLVFGYVLNDSVSAQDQLNNLPKSATEFTAKINKAVYNQLDFADSTDFIEARRGFIATLDSGIIRNEAGVSIVNTHDYDFLTGKSPESVNPALWRQAKLNITNGLFKVVDGIYQIRSFDVATMSVIETNTGYIVVDPLTNADASRAGLNLVKKYVGEKPVLAVITTHSHSDHFGGIEGVASATDIESGKVKYIVPSGFYSEVVSESILLGNAMSRRAGYQFGVSLPKNEYGTVDSGLGKGFIGGGYSSLLEPNTLISKTGDTLNIDGLKLVFQLTPGSEAPAELHFFIPKYKAFCPAENATHTLHNVLTPRGAKVRDTKAWSSYLDEAIDLFGDQTEVVFPSHHWPIFGHERSIKFLEDQRDLYKYIHDQTIHLANKGLNMDEIAETIKLPDELGKKWYNQGFYGTIQHNSKAVYQLYLGWWDGNPANYNKLPEVEAAKRYTEFMGGEAAVISKARASFKKGEYRWVAEVLKHVVFTNPNNQEARNLQADAFEQIAYQSESAIWRNLYLVGAKELRKSKQQATETGKDRRSAKYLRKLSIEAIFDYISIAIDGEKAAGKDVSVRFIFPDVNKNLFVTLKNGVLHYKENKPDAAVDFKLTIPKQKFVEGIADPDKFRSIVFGKDVIRDGNVFKLKELLEDVEKFDPNWNIVTP
ncbi:MAG: alkyl sulfatase dimerization domain-containing protein [Mariniphaga sp.]